MKKIYFIIILLSIISSSYGQVLKKTKKVVSVMSQQTFYLNGGMKSIMGGKSRTYFKIDLPPNTISWYYTFTTKEGKSNPSALNLVSQLTRFYDPTGVTALTLNAIGTPTGVAACDIYLMDRKNADAFINKVDYTGGTYYYNVSGSRENFRNGVVKVDESIAKTKYLGFKNPSASTGISISFEVAAIVEEEIIDNTTWVKETKEHFFKEFYTDFKNQGVAEEVAKSLSNCLVEKISLNKTPESYDAMATNQKEIFLEEIYSDCVKKIDGIDSERNEKAMTYCNLGWKSYENGDIERCIEYSKKALSFDSALGIVKSNLGLCYLIKGDESIATDYYIEALSDIKRIKLISQIKFYLQATIDDIENALRKYPNMKGHLAIRSLFKDELRNY